MHYTFIKTNSELTIHAEICDTFWTKFMGLMFRKELPKNTGLLFQYNNESILNTTIHMLFMRFPIAAIWINSNNVIVDKTIAFPWRLAYSPSMPACAILETHPHHLDEFLIGEKIKLHEKL